MSHHWILPAPEYYARLNAYMLEVGLPYSIADSRRWEEVAPYLHGILGDAQGQSVLDCCCGWGTQAIPLAKLGWQVTACDVSPTNIEFARQYAAQENVAVDFRMCDMRDLARVFDQQFDCVVSCYGLYEISTDAELCQAIHGMYTALKPGGRCYLELRDMDALMEEPRERHIFRGEKHTPHGRIICIQDWDYESDSTVVEMEAFLREDERRDPTDHFRWVSETIGVRKKVLRKAELQHLLCSAGFDPVTFIAKPQPWDPLQVIATRPG